MGTPTYTPYDESQSKGIAPYSSYNADHNTSQASVSDYYVSKQTAPATSVPTYKQTAPATTGIPPVQQYEMSARDFNAQQKQRSFDNGMSQANLGLSLFSDGVNAWSQYEKMKQQKEAFKFNKDMQTKQFAMAKDAYDRQVRRSNSIADHYAPKGE